MAIRDGEVPLVSIGLPVYNGERYLRHSLESLLSQDYANFELIIADNGSQDNTFAICREYQRQDRRIRLYKNDTNIGIAGNFNKVFNLSAAPYFMWAGHDDLWEKSYISKCVAKLAQNPAAVMCISEVRLVDQDGHERQPEYGERESGRETVGMDVVQRVHILLAHMFWYEIYGVIRGDCLKKTRLMQERYGCDLILLMELLLLGEFVKVPEKLFSYRRHQPDMSEAKLAAMEPAKALKESFTTLARDLWEAVLAANLSDPLKQRVQGEFVRCLSGENIVWRNLILTENRSLLPAGATWEDVPRLVRNIIFRSN